MSREHGRRNERSIGWGVVALLLFGPGGFLQASEVTAIGVGPAFRYADHSGDYSEGNDNDEIDFDGDIVSFGLQLDTNVARNRLFNYRLELMVERIEAHFDYDETDSRIFNPLGLPSLNQEVTGYGFGIDQTFGFGLWRTSRFRLYLGPKLRLGIWGGTSEDNTPVNISDTKYVGLDAGLGAELGLNLHLGGNVSISPSVSYLAGVAVIWTDDNRRRTDRLDLFGGDDDYRYDGFNHRVTVGVSILFRSGSDNF